MEKAAPGRQRSRQRFRLQTFAVQDSERPANLVRSQAFRRDFADSFEQMT
jgi:hypothetical protein